ncbi:uncharacterized protein LOC142357095, partial [Convolutriloba macropyga]|uniref:uncharacterized protein LOC142357095 n=1 Tax=Convolutriloba macropyga TaxID=536237 RepID=UPI003F5273DE
EIKQLLSTWKGENNWETILVIELPSSGSELDSTIRGGNEECFLHYSTKHTKLVSFELQWSYSYVQMVKLSFPLNYGGDQITVKVCLGKFCESDFCEALDYSGGTELRTVRCGYTGDSIAIYSEGNNEHLALCQVEVYGYEYQ